MAITSLTTDYSGRTKDLFISQGINPSKVGKQPVTYSFGNVSSYVAGIEKLAQRYIISLFNTGLLRQLQTARGSNIQDASHIFNFANWSVLQEFKTYQNENPDFPTDEQIATAYLTDINVEPGRLYFRIKLVTKAGSDVPFVLPITLT